MRLLTVVTVHMRLLTIGRAQESAGAAPSAGMHGRHLAADVRHHRLCEGNLVQKK
jgi:hypothetical protein